MSDMEKFEKLTSGIQHIAVVVGVLASGVWALINFGLSEVAKNEAALREQKANPFPNVALDRLCVIPEKNRWNVVVSVAVDNKSTSEMRLATTELSLVSAAKITFLKDATLQYGDVAYGVEGNFYNSKAGADVSISFQTEIVARAGETGSYRYIIPVKEHGLHQISFHANDVQGRLGSENQNFLVIEYIMLPEEFGDAGTQQCVAGDI